MRYGDRLYEVYLIRGQAGGAIPWQAPAWDWIAQTLDPLIKGARGPAAVRSTQLQQGVGSPNQREISFGRIGWNEKGHAKWTHQRSPNKPTVDFLSTEVWGPSWTICQREQMPPDIFMTIHNAGHSGAIIPQILIAAATGWSATSSLQIQPVADLMAQKMDASLRAKCERLWSYPFGSSLLSSALNDLGVSGLYKPGLNGHSRELSDLVGSWVLF